MNDLKLINLKNSLRNAFFEILNKKSVEELRKLDWTSLNPDFYIEQDENNNKKVA